MRHTTGSNTSSSSLDVYAGSGWRVPDILQRFQESDDVYFDAVSRVGLDAWSRGRCVLVGDAASCVSLFGEGSSMAIIGAATLAAALNSHPDDVGAFRGYERARPAARLDR